MYLIITKSILKISGFKKVFKNSMADMQEVVKGLTDFTFELTEI